MNLIFVGPQASGKGTQGKIVAEKLGLCHISMGDLLRNVEDENIKQILASGKLVPVELTIKLLNERISKDDFKKGFILDGFPRSLEQAKELDKITRIDQVVEISISDEEAVRRLSGRLTCSKCGAIFNEITNPRPKISGICDKCNGKLYKRADDNESAIRKRLEIYHKETEPILKHYPSVRINGEQSIEKVSEDVLDILV